MRDRARALLPTGPAGLLVLGLLAPSAGRALFDGRDLALTTDFRLVLSEVLAKHIGVTNLNAVFPGFDGSPRRFPGLIRA